MTARVLVVDDIIANVKLLEARLSAEYFEVLVAYNGPDALAICEGGQADIVLLDVMMPGMDGFEVCQKLKANPKTHHIPVVMITALDQPTDKVRGLNAGADDFLTKPVDDVALITRVKNLARLKMLTDEMMMRASTSEQMGLNDDLFVSWSDLNKNGGKIMIVEDHARSSERIAAAIESHHEHEIESDPQTALFRLVEGNFDLLITSLNLMEHDGLRLCSQVRSLERTRHLPIIIIVEPGDEHRLLRGLEMGINDYLTRPLDRNELFARVATQVKRKRYADLLRQRLEESVEMAITDPLTGLHNRRYMESHTRTLVVEAIQKGKPLSVFMVDMDYFKSVNDTHGHDAGDEVLKIFSERLSHNIRGIDLACRIGGEEFVVVMPDTNLPQAYIVAERVRQAIASEPFVIGNGASLNLTASVGLASLEDQNDTPQSILKRADQALYVAKRDGRNRVVADAA